ncbi:MAG TPA: glycosyl transferase family 2, partial [Cyanobacteria bacterium UBA8543]|nr:glycosyl transferase family 2 [Cyanobacteria bacterium UBA8543]
IQYGGLPEYWWTWIHRHYQEFFGEEVAQKLYSYPLLNAGVFALHKNAPHWQVWAEFLEQGLQQSASLMTDQFARNVVVYQGGLFDDTEMLPAWCNWTCHTCLPSWDKKKDCFVEPYLPHTPIGILHLTREKYKRETVVANDRTEVEVSFRYTSQNLSNTSEEIDLNRQADKEQIEQSFTDRTLDETAETINCSLLPVGDYVSPKFKVILLDQCFP